MKSFLIIFSILTFFTITVIGNQKNTSLLNDNAHIFLESSKTESEHLDTDSLSIPVTKTQRLSEKTWKVDFVHHVIGGLYSYYDLKGKNTTGFEYGNMRFKFNTNGTGSHVSCNGIQYKFDWRWLSKDCRKLSLKINGKSDVWNMVEISGNYLHGSCNVFVDNSYNNLETFRLIQIP